jgi:hypothetical protein
MRRSVRLLAAAACLALPAVGTQRALATNWRVEDGVRPNPMHRDEPHARVLALSRIGAVCVARIDYIGTHQRPIILRSVTIKSTAIVTWPFHSKTSAKRGRATVTCIYHGATLKSFSYFAVLPR